MTRFRRTVSTALALAGLSAMALLGAEFLDESGASDLGRPLRPLSVVSDSSYPARPARGEQRTFRDVALETAGAGTVRFTVSEPPDPAAPAPLVVVLAGFGTGRDALELFDGHGEARIVAYEYPYSPDRWNRGAKWRQVPEARAAALRVPAQVAAIRAWLEERGAVDRDRTALLGFSFGAVFAPAVQRLAAERGAPYRAVGLAFGGAGIDAMVRRALSEEPGWLEAAAAGAVAAAAAPLEPARHLPRLPGTFMLVHGERDRRIPAEAARRLTRLTPEPKRVVRVPGAGHLHPAKEELLARVASLFRGWLVQQGVLAGGAGVGGDAAGRFGPRPPNGAGESG